jgi:hypothetical protein
MATIRRVKWLLILLTAVALASAASAPASNAPSPQIDQIASEVAGKSVTAWCETNLYDWDNYVRSVMPGRIGADMLGYTVYGGNQVRLSPLVCQTLRTGLRYGYREVGIVYLPLAVLTLAHESVHARGVRDEGVADCTALPLVPSFMERFFGLTKTIEKTELRPVQHTMRKKIAGKWRKITYTTMQSVTVNVPNPDYQRAAEWALTWHRVAGPEYQGNC